MTCTWWSPGRFIPEQAQNAMYMTEPWMTCTWRSPGLLVPEGTPNSLYLTEPWMTPTSRSMEWMTCSYNNLQTEKYSMTTTNPRICLTLNFFTCLLGGKWAEERLGDILASIRYTCKQLSGTVFYRALSMANLAIEETSLIAYTDKLGEVWTIFPISSRQIGTRFRWGNRFDIAKCSVADPDQDLSDPYVFWASWIRILLSPRKK